MAKYFSRFALLLGMAMLLGGCRIQVSVPQGGSVTTASGNYECAAGTICFVDVRDLLFDETFEAVAVQGYGFSGWRVRDLGLCGGRTEPCRLYTSLFEGSALLMAILNSDDIFHLEPVFDNGTPWVINTVNRSGHIFESGSSQGVLEDVQSVEFDTDYMYVQTTGIPNYDVVITEDILESLNTRPLAARDFAGGVSTASEGDIVSFGQYIAYNSSDQNCNDTGGSGYWPPGPECPLDLGRGEYFATEPVPAGEDCESGLGTVGMMVNGSAIFNWGDGMSWGNGIWYTLAPVAEQYDVDICGGHAANGEYHHHFYTTCLAALVGDYGAGHSPIYGFAADGYPVYGPWEDKDTLAVSGWDARDYGADPGEGGCGTPGERSCILVDEYDVSSGVDSSVAAGPDIGEAVTTLSGNTLAAADGYFYEDYYYAGRSATGPQLDQHNGHDNDDGRGYHYHISLVEDASAKLQPAFPYTLGPRFHGELPDNAVTACGGVGGVGNGMPPPMR